MKKIVRFITILLTLTMLLSVPVYAGSTSGSGDDGDVDPGTVEKRDGFLATKSGYIVYTSGANGVATSPIVAFCWNGGSPYSTTGAPVIKNLATRFGQPATFDTSLSAPWGIPPFNGSSGAGSYIKNWLMFTEVGDFSCGADYVMAQMLHMSESQILDWYADPNNRLNVEPFLFGGYYTGASASSFSGAVFCASTTAWAKVADQNNFGGRYTHKNLPNCMVHDIPVYPQYPVPSDKNSRHDSGTILSHAYGIVTVMPVTGKQIVKVYKTDGVVDNTSYSFTDTPVEVKDEGSYKVKKWDTSKQKTKAKSTKADYPEVTAGCELVKSGSGPATVDMQPEEKAIFVLLEREEVDVSPALTPDAIRAHELNVVFRYMDGLRDETAGAGRAFEGVNFIFNNVKSQYERPTSDTVRNWETDEDYEVVEECSGATAESGRAVHYYNEAVGYYLPWNETKDPFGLDEEIDTHYSVNVSRVYWESNLHSVEYRDSGMNGYADEVLGISPSLIGEITEADPGSNVESTLPDAQVNNYSFTAKLQEYWEERDILGYEKEIDEETGEEIEGDPIYSEWRDLNDWILHKIVDYSITTYCDKYKVMVTPQASVESAGTVLEEFSGNTLLGHSALPVQIVSTQLSGTLTFYPEVPMTVWYTPDLVNYAEPTNELIYILGEYPRKCTPPAMHGYSTRIEGGRMEGTTTLPAPATGTVAQETYDYYAERGNFINGVTAMGTTFETATKNRHQMTIGSVIFDCTDEYGVESAWNNSWVDPEGSHDAYESQLVSRLDTQMILQFFKGGNPYGAPYTMTADVSDYSLQRDEKLVELEWKEGSLVNKGEVIEGINWAFNVSNGSELYSKWGLDEMLNTMYISTSDPKSENASGNDLSADSALGRSNPWYDEESITMVIRFYRTDITFGQLIGDDKVDYNMLQQSNINRYDRKNTDPSNSLEARLYSRLYLIGDDPKINADGYSFDHTSTVRFDEIERARFAIVNSTTEQMKK